MPLPSFAYSPYFAVNDLRLVFVAPGHGKSNLVKVWWATQIQASRAEALAKAGSRKIAWTRLRWATSRQARLTERIPNEN
jgi:hypothetical protein